ncbi:MAG: NBR1-Ig-like domain-containing protein [Anaerolineaceae bacterium]|jgi:hypothetical protein
MKRKSSLLLILSILLLLTMACSMLQSAKKDDPNAVITIAAQTLEAIFTATSQSLAPTPQATAVPPTATEPVASPTPLPSATATEVPPTPTNTEIPIPCNKAKFVTDVTIPDGTVINVNQSFVKTWRITNEGSCTWTTGYQLVFASGEQMSAPSSVGFPKNVPPGSSVDISVQLVSPNSGGDFTARFKLKANDGTIFGVGTKDAPLTVVLKVPSPATKTPSKPATGCEVHYNLVDMWIDGRFDARAELINNSSTTWTSDFVIAPVSGATDKVEWFFYGIDKTGPGKSYYFTVEGYDEYKGKYDFTIFWELMNPNENWKTYCYFETRYVK